MKAYCWQKGTALRLGLVVVCLVWVCMGITGEAGAGLAEGLAKCSAIADSAERLKCYDALARNLPAAPLVPPEKVGAWKREISKSPMDDAPNVTLSLAAQTPVRVEGASYHPFLYIRCKAGKAEAFIRFGFALGSANPIPVRLRLDKKEAFNQEWTLSTSGKAAFAPGPVFFRGLLGHKRLLVGVAPAQGNPVLISFDLTGLELALTPVKKSCGMR